MESKKGNYNLLCKAHIHKKLSFVTMKVKDSNTFYCTSEITILLLRVGQQQFHLLDHKCITYISRDESSSRSRTVTGLCPAEGPCQSDRQDSTDLLSKNQTIYVYIFFGLKLRGAVLILNSATQVKLAFNLNKTLLDHLGGSYLNKTVLIMKWIKRLN